MIVLTTSHWCIAATELTFCACSLGLNSLSSAHQPLALSHSMLLCSWCSMMTISAFLKSLNSHSGGRPIFFGTNALTLFRDATTSAARAQQIGQLAIWATPWLTSAAVIL